MLEQAEADSCLPGAGHVPCPLCGNGTVWQSQGSLECSRRASMLRVCRLGRATARHPCVLGLTWLALGGAPRSGGAAVPLRVQREAECRAPASAEVADSETPLDTPRRASHACPLQLLTSPNPSPNPNPNQVRLARLPSPAAHRRPPRAAAAAPREDGHLATAARELGLPRRGAVRAAWPKCPGPLQPAGARCSHPPLQTPTRFARGFPLGPRGKAPSRGCRRGAVAALWYVRPRRRPHRLWPCRCRLPFAGESRGLLLLGCGTCGVIVTVV